jgi:DNA polymerase-3 subunit beta
MITKIRIHLKSLLAILDQAGKTVSTKTTLPILQCILLRVETDALAVSATDLEQYFSSHTTAVVDGEVCGVAVPFENLASFLKTCKGAPEAAIEIDTETQRVTVKVGRARANIAGLKADEFPPCPEEGKTVLSLPAPTLKSAIGRTLPCVSSDIARAELNCLQLATIQGKTCLTGVDGIRLATLVLDGALPKDTCMLLPRNAMKDLTALIPKEGTVELSASKRAVLFAWEEVRFWVMLMEGKFPDWPGLIPQQFAHTVPLHAGELLAAVKTASVFTDNAAVAVSLSPVGEEKLRISAGGNDGSASVELDLIFPFEIAFNGQFLAEGLELFGDGPVSLRLNGSKAPAVFQEGEFTFILMPVLIEHSAVKVEVEEEAVA